MKNKIRVPAPPVWGVVAAFTAVYVIWGSTYLGIRYAVESIPPFLMAGTRNLTAGLLLYGFARLRGSGRPSRLEWRDAAVTGGLLLTVGNGGVTWAEQVIPSSVTALLVGLTPLWMVIFDWLRPNGVRPGGGVVAGLAVGFTGVALLAHQGSRFGPAYGWGVAALMTASLSWSFGSIYGRHAHKPATSLLGVGMQMIAGGSLLLALSTGRGEVTHFSPGQMTPLSVGAWLYLVLAGSLVGYSCYVWLLHATTPARVATYAYVNPLIAVLLGCTIGRETFSHELFVAGGLILAAVVLIVRSEARPAATPTPAEEVA